jgi:ABC-type uncharacterized transport system substrate-binding protein
MRWRGSVIAACALLVQSATASAQTAVPVVGLLSSRSEADSPTVVEDLRKGLEEAGYAEPGSVLIEYRWADGGYDRLQGLAAELVGRHVAVLVTTGGIVLALAAKQATPEALSRSATVQQGSHRSACARHRREADAAFR